MSATEAVSMAVITEAVITEADDRSLECSMSVTENRTRADVSYRHAT